MKTKTKNKSGRTKKQQQKKIIIASVAVGAAGILGYFGWQYFKKKKDAKSNTDLDEVIKSDNSPIENIKPDIPYVKSKNTSITTPVRITPNNTVKSDFPIKKGSKGEKVRELQQALIAKYGKSILPKYGADGDFGSETINALKKAGLPPTIDESTFNVLTQATKPDSGLIGKELYDAAASKNYNKVISLLHQLRTAEDYSSANEVFKQNRLGSVRQTIVNGLLNTFTSTAQKEAIRFEFLRIGLQFDGSKWSLSGFDGRPVVTIEPTTVWVTATEGMKVPSRMVLGNEVAKRLDYTLFENNGKYFLVTTKSVQYLN